MGWLMQSYFAGSGQDIQSFLYDLKECFKSNVLNIGLVYDMSGVKHRPV